MNNIYTINDELTPQPVTTDVDNTSATPDLQQQLGALEAQRQADLDHINRNYQDLNQEYDDQLDIIDNLHKTVSRRKVVDPRAVQARQALGSLYDTIQLIGSAASMAGKTTPPAPQLTSAQAQQNTIADRLYAAQRQADQDYATQLRHITQRQQQARTDLARKRRQAKTEADRMRLNTNKHYDTLFTRLTEGERDRQNRTRIAIERNATAIKQTNIRAYGGGGSGANKYDLFDFDGSSYRLPANMRKDFSSAVGNLVNNSDNATRYGAKLSGTALHMAILRGVLNGDIQVNANTYQDALDIFDTYFTPANVSTQSASRDAIALRPTSNTDNTNVWDQASIDEEELDW